MKDCKKQEVGLVPAKPTQACLLALIKVIRSASPPTHTPRGAMRQRPYPCVLAGTHSTFSGQSWVFSGRHFKGTKVILGMWLWAGRGYFWCFVPLFINQDLSLVETALTQRSLAKGWSRRESLQCIEHQAWLPYSVRAKWWDSGFKFEATDK